MFAVRNRFANPQTKTLSPQFADLRTCGPVCGSAQHCLCVSNMTFYNRAFLNDCLINRIKKAVLILRPVLLEIDQTQHVSNISFIFEAF